MTPDASRRTQVKRWLLVLLVLGHEAHVMANVLGANASEPRALRHDIFAAPKWLDAATLRRLQVALGGDWTWPTGSSLLFSWKKGSGNAIEVVQTKGVDTVEVVASLVYDKMEISTEDPNMPIGAAHTSPAVKLVQGTADRTLCWGKPSFGSKLCLRCARRERCYRQCRRLGQDKWRPVIDEFREPADQLTGEHHFHARRTVQVMLHAGRHLRRERRVRSE